MAVVYLHRKESDNSIYYVGIGSDKKRARQIRGRSEYWTRVFNKYGRIVEIVANNIPLEEAKELEVFLIQEIGIDNLCNHTLGGEGFFGGKHTKETKLKISIAHKGKKLSNETKLKISEKLKGHPNYLKRQTKETRLKISLSSKGRIHKQKSKDIISEKHKNNNHKPKKEALKKATEARRKKGLLIRDVNNDIVFKGYESEKYTKVPKRLVYENSKKNKPITQGKYKGENFIRITKNY